MTCLTVAFLLFATPEPQADPPPIDPPGILVGDDWRYQHHSILGGLIKRTLADLVAIPSGVGGWSWGDWLALTAFAGTTVAFEWPLGPSIDVRLHASLQHKLGEGHLKLWTPMGDTLIWLSIWSGFAGLLAYGLVSGDSPYTETVVLALEAWIVTQLYVNFIKVWTGREGPGDEGGQGEFHGPAGYLKYFPAGTPSGHVASIWALFTVVMEYWQHPAVYVLLSAVGVVLSVTTVTDDYHFTSEAILGAAMGIAIGRWVVRHRSSRYRYIDGGYIERVAVTPAVVPGSSYGIALSFAF